MGNIKNILGYALVAMLVAAGSACTNLDEEIKGDFTKKFDDSNHGVGIRNNVNKPQPNDGLQGAFSGLLKGTATNGGFFAVQETGTDEAVITQKGGDWYDGGLYIQMHHHDFTPQTWAINDTWSQAYDGILQANTLLGLTGDEKMDTAQVAQLRVLRAYYLWRLMDVFGRIKIPVVAGTDAPQVDRPVAYNFIVNELLEAIPDLSPGKQEYGRVSQSAANALLARIYLNAAVYKNSPEYQKAIDAADMVINSGIYNLSESYAAVFAPDNVENPEHIFVVPFDESTGTGETWAQMTLHYPSQLTYKLAEQPWNGFSTLEDFYNSYDDNDERKAANFIEGPQFDLNGNPILDLAFDKADDDGPAINYTPFINELFPNASRQGGARFGKFAFKIGQGNDMDNDYPLLRYGEVLLNKAEAIARMTGNFSDPTALELVNELRTRAGATPFTTMTEGDMLAERGRELFVEGLRRTDLIRFGAYGNAWWEKPADPDPNHNVMAIPHEQMEADATYPLTQNPGY
jgi:tetratricopeptide (TPR) repeat protein